MAKCPRHYRFDRGGAVPSTEVQRVQFLSAEPLTGPERHTRGTSQPAEPRRREVHHNTWTMHRHLTTESFVVDEQRIEGTQQVGHDVTTCSCL
jgi:hypothetical protein